MHAKKCQVFFSLKPGRYAQHAGLAKRILKYPAPYPPTRCALTELGRKEKVLGTQFCVGFTTWPWPRNVWIQMSAGLCPWLWREKLSWSALWSACCSFYLTQPLLLGDFAASNASKHYSLVCSATIDVNKTFCLDCTVQTQTSRCCSMILYRHIIGKFSQCLGAGPHMSHSSNRH